MDTKKPKKAPRKDSGGFFKRIFGRRPQKNKRMDVGEIHMVDYVFDLEGKGTLKRHPAAIVEDFAGPEPFDFEKWDPDAKKSKKSQKGKDKVDVIVLGTSKVPSKGGKKKLPPADDDARKRKERGLPKKDKGKNNQKEQGLVPFVERFFRDAIHGDPTTLRDGTTKYRHGEMKEKIDYIEKSSGRKNGFRDHTKRKDAILHASLYAKASRAKKRHQNRQKKKGGK